MLRTEISSMGTDIGYLKDKMENSKAEKIVTVKIEPSCRNCNDSKSALAQLK